MEVADFRWEGHRLVYEVHGDGPRVFVYLPGLLLDATLNRVIAAMLAEQGHRVVIPELLGHGRSDRPTHAYRHRLELWSEQVEALLDHLGIDEAVVGGVSLGANVALQLATTSPARLRAMVLEMPVLERGMLVGAATFLPMIVSLRYQPLLWRPLSWVARRLPDAGHPLDSFRHIVASAPRETAAVLHGLFVGPTCPPARDRRRLDVPALVLGHTRDALHPLDDAEALARELPDARFVQARSVAEARLRPHRVVAAMSTFLDEVWQPRPTDGSTRGASGDGSG